MSSLLISDLNSSLNSRWGAKTHRHSALRGMSLTRVLKFEGWNSQFILTYGFMKIYIGIHSSHCDFIKSRNLITSIHHQTVYVIPPALFIQLFSWVTAEFLESLRGWQRCSKHTLSELLYHKTPTHFSCSQSSGGNYLPCFDTFSRKLRQSWKHKVPECREVSCHKCMD